MNLRESNSRSSAANILFFLIFLAVIIVISYFVAQWATPRIFPVEGSAESQQVDGMFKIFLFIGGTIFFLVQGLLVYSVIRYRVRSGDTTDGPPIHGNTVLEIVWTIIPAIIVTFLAIISYQVWVTTRAPKPNENMINNQEVPITVVAQRFAWSFEYHTPQTVKDSKGNDVPVVLKTNVLHTFVGQNLHLNIISRDVNHSFWIPAMRIKQDALPGYTTDIRFVPIIPSYTGDYTGDLATQAFPIVCAELCGPGHGGMRAWIVVHPTEEAFLNAFYNDALQTALNRPTDPVEYGRTLLSSGAYPCSGCHTMDSLGWTAKVGPNLSLVGDRAATQEAGYTAEEYLVQAVYHPSDFIVPGYTPLMPQFGTDANPMPPDDLLGIVSYLCQLTSDGHSACNADNLNALVDSYR